MQTPPLPSPRLVASVWYSCPMIQKGMAAFAILLMIAQSHPAAFAQANQPSNTHSQSSGASTPAKPSTPRSPAGNPGNALPAGSRGVSQGANGGAPGTPSASANPANAANPAAPTDCFGGNCEFQPPHISIATPAPAPAPWPWQERIAWGANIVLVALGYVAILIALSLLRKIERQTRYAETAAQAAQESAQAALQGAQAALAQAQAWGRAERPWVLVSVRPAHHVDNGFAVIATNRGHGPALIVSTVDEVVSAVDEARLAAAPEYRNSPVSPENPVILLPGDTFELVAFSRADVKRICETEERFARVEKWEEKIFLYGRVIYRDLAAPDDAPQHESSWFCWYIHGRQKSGMVMAGPPAYNRHT